MTTTDHSSYPEYENSPLIEVVCGVVFQPIQSLLTPHIGLLWEKLKRDYPSCRELAPLTPPLELYENLPSELTLELSDIPPLPRVWFVDAEGNGIIQVQRDRFLYNWRKGNSKNSYPRYSQVFRQFTKHLSTFSQFLVETELEPISPLQYEITYVNHILQGEGWHDFSDIGKIFPFLNLEPSKDEFSSLEAINSRLTFNLPDGIGRLHMSIRSGIRQQGDRPVLLFDLTARGIGENQSRDRIEEWFDPAHFHIIQTFEKLTSQEIKDNTWRAKND
ncbi:MAG: TIGR04255 family protein [Limnospira sp.]